MKTFKISIVLNAEGNVDWVIDSISEQLESNESIESYNISETKQRYNKGVPENGEKDSHPLWLLGFDGYDDLIKRIDEIEKKQAERFPHLIKRLEKLEKN